MDECRKIQSSSPPRVATLKTSQAAEEALMDVHCLQICAALRCSALDATDICVDIRDLVQRHAGQYDRAVRKAVLGEAWRLWSSVALDERRGVVAGLHAVERWLRSPLQL